MAVGLKEGVNVMVMLGTTVAYLLEVLEEGT